MAQRLKLSQSHFTFASISVDSMPLCCGLVGIRIAGSAVAPDFVALSVLMGCSPGTPRLHLALRRYFLDTGWTHLIHDGMAEPGWVHRQGNKRRKTSA